MLRTRVVTSLNRDLSRIPRCIVCGESRGLYRKARMCRKCIREGINRTNFFVE